MEKDSDNDSDDNSDNDPNVSYGNHNNHNNFACPTPHPGLGFYVSTKLKSEGKPPAENKKMKVDEEVQIAPIRSYEIDEYEA